MDPVTGVAAATGLVLGGVGAAGGVGAWALAYGRSLRAQLAEAGFARDLLHQRATELEAQASRAEQELASARSRAKALAQEASGLSSHGEGLASELADLRGEAARLDERCRALEGRAVAAEQAREAARRELAAERAAIARIKQTLSALGLVLPDRAWSPKDPDRRAAARAALQSLVVDTGSSAAAVVDRQGLALFAVGLEEIADRVAVAAGLFAGFEPELGALLCAPVDELRISTPRSTTHLMPVAGTPYLVGVENQGAAPLHAVTRARLALFGRPEPARPVVDAPATVPEITRAPDPEVERMLRAWARRWSVEQVALLDAAGQVVGASDPRAVGPAIGLRRAIGTTLARFARDGWALDAVELRARAGSVGVVLRPIDGDRESPVLVASGSALPDEGALDELAATARWHLAPLTTRAAGRP